MTLIQPTTDRRERMGAQLVGQAFAVIATRPTKLKPNETLLLVYMALTALEGRSSMTEIDTGIRRERHVGEVFPPRCSDCDAEARAGQAEAPVPPRYRVYVPGSECPLHRGYPMPCDRCERDEAEV